MTEPAAHVDGHRQDHHAPTTPIFVATRVGVNAEAVTRLRWWTLVRHCVRPRSWGSLRRLVEEPAPGPRDPDRYTWTEAHTAAVAATTAQQLIDETVDRAMSSADAADQHDVTAEDADDKAEQQLREATRTLHGHVVTNADAGYRASELARRIREDEQCDRRRHRRMPTPVLRAADALFTFDVIAWAKLMISAFNVDLQDPNTSWIPPIVLSLILPGFTYAVTRVYAILLRDRALTPSGTAARGRRLIIGLGPAVLTAASALTFLAMYFRVYGDLKNSDHGGAAGTIMASAIAFAIATAPWVVLLARAFDGSPELDELAHLSAELLDAQRERLRHQARAAHHRTLARDIRRRARRRANADMHAASRPMQRADRIILLARGIHQSAGIYAHLRPAATAGPEGLLPPNMPLHRQGLEKALEALADEE